MKSGAILTSSRVRAGRWLLSAMAMLLFWPASGHAQRDLQPALRIPLAPLGYPPRQRNRETEGDAMFTVNFVDSTHLLFTYTSRGMLVRIPTDPLDDEDRSVVALLLELPTGKVVTRTIWRLHDYGQFLWELGDGRFLLRVRNQFTTLAPLADEKDPWAQQPLYQLADDLLFRDLQIAQDRGVMVIQVSQRPTAAADAVRESYNLPQQLPVMAQFVRLLPSAEPNGPMKVRLDTTVQRKNPTEFSVTSTGFMQIKKEGLRRWGFNYREFSGKLKPLAAIESSCQPFPLFVSGAEFVSFSCRGGTEGAALTGFNLAGDTSWSIHFDHAQSYATLSTAPEAGRFAISHSHANVFSAPIVPAEIKRQEVLVLQAHSGKPLLRVDCSPIQALGQNFALSPDGMQFAIMQGELLIYTLPPLSKQDQKALAATKGMMIAAAPELKVDLGVGAPELARKMTARVAAPGFTAPRPSAYATAVANLSDSDDLPFPPIGTPLSDPASSASAVSSAGDDGPQDLPFPPAPAPAPSSAGNPPRSAPVQAAAASKPSDPSWNRSPDETAGAEQPLELPRLRSSIF